MAAGIVKWFNNDKGFGFIGPSDRTEDVFAQFSSIVAAGGHSSLAENDRVECTVGAGRKGPQAENISDVR